MRNILIVSLIILCIGLLSCGSYTTTSVSKMRQIELGMSKDRVISLLGKDYKPASAIEKDGNLFETISYNAGHDNEEYVYYFKNGILQKWRKEIMTQDKYLRESAPKQVAPKSSAGSN